MINCAVRSTLKGAVGLACLGILALGTAALAQDDMPPTLPNGTRAPEFTSRTIHGHRVSLRALRGHVVLVDFWATWCAPCKVSMPELEHLYKSYRGQGFRVIGMSIDDPSSAGDIKPTVRELGVTYTITSTKHANATAGAAYDVFGGVPVEYLIDKRGIIRWSQAGYSYDERAILSKKIAKLQRE